MFSVKQSFNQSAHHYNDVSVLQQEIANRLFQRLELLKPKTKTIIDLGAGTGISTHLLQQNFTHSHIIAVDIAQMPLLINQQAHPKTSAICADAYHLPFANQSIDLIISNAMLQWCWDLPSILKECQRVLGRNGLFIFTTFGLDTLIELKKSWAMVDDKTHVNHFFDMHTIGDMLLTCGLKDPVMETEYITLTYQKVVEIMSDLKKLGANYVPDANRGLTGKNAFSQMISAYETFRHNGKLPTTYEVIYGHVWQSNHVFKEIDIDHA